MKGLITYVEPSMELAKARLYLVLVHRICSDTVGPVVSRLLARSRGSCVAGSLYFPLFQTTLITAF